MKRYAQVFSLGILAMLLLPQVCMAQNPSVKMNIFNVQDNRHLGNADVGDVSSYGLELYMNSPRRYGLGIKFSQYDNNLRNGVGLVLPKNEFALGLSMRMAKRCGLRLAITQEQFLNDDPFSSFGMYPYYDAERLGVELGFERSQDNTDFGFLVGKFRTGNDTLFVGMSEEQFEVRHADVQTFRHERIGAGYLFHAPAARFQAFAGGNFNIDEEKPTWVAGISRYATLDSTGLDPVIIAVFRHKPESWYSLGIFTLGKSSIEMYGSKGILEAFFTGGLKRSRIIGSRYFDTPGIGSSYELQDYGTLAIATSMLSVDAGATAQLVSRDVSGYLTYPGALGRVMNPFFGITFTEFSDLIYDPEVHRLADPQQRYWEFKVGAKIPLHERGDSRRHQLGYLRLGAKINTNGGVAVKATTWF